MRELDKINFFDMFNLPISPILEETNLEYAYNNLLSDFHPDKFQDRTKKDLAKAILDKANSAYKILKCGLSRRIYLLKLKHINLAEENECPQIDINFFDEIIDLSENNETVKAQELMQIEINKFDEFYDKNDYKTAAESILKAKYYKKIWNNL